MSYISSHFTLFNLKKYRNMKKSTSLILLFACMSIFFSCSTKVDLYTDYKDIPVIYGILDVNADTNYIKINKAFCGSKDNPINAYEVALISDSSNYPEKLKAYIVEKKNTNGQHYEPTGRIIPLDTLTIHDKEEGVFYSPDQTLYYTTEKFNINENGNKYKYKLVVVKPDGDTVTSETSPVGGNIRIVSGAVNFQSAPSTGLNRLMFKSSDEAVLYDISMQFNYREKHPGQATVKKHVKWSYGAKPLSSYEKVPATENSYYHHYSVNTLFKHLEEAIGGDTIWNINHPNVIRYIDDFVITLSVGGRELYECYEINNVIETGYTTTNYSNINGGFGVFSSRTCVNRIIKLSATTRRDIFKKEAWGFVEE